MSVAATLAIGIWLAMPPVAVAESLRQALESTYKVNPKIDADAPTVIAVIAMRASAVAVSLFMTVTSCCRSTRSRPRSG